MSRGERPSMTKAGREAIKTSRLISNRHGRRRQCRATRVVKKKKTLGGAKTLAHTRVRTRIIQSEFRDLHASAVAVHTFDVILGNRVWIAPFLSRFDFARYATTFAE